MNECLSITVEGKLVQVRFTSITVDEEGFVVLKGKPYIKKEKKSEKESSKEKIRSYELHSALVRMMYGDELVTAAVTHCTDKAWRVINLQLGVCWIPRNILKWSEIAGQFCVVERDWNPDWCTPTPGLDHYPALFDPDSLISELHLHIE